MLRIALLVLLLANAGYLAWSQGWMKTLGWAPAVQSESHRLLQQVRPEVLQLLSTTTPTDDEPAPVWTPEAAATTAANPAPNDADPAATTPDTAPDALDAAAPAALMATATQAAAAAEPGPAPEPGQCLQAGGLDEAQMPALRQALQQLDMPSSSWSLEPTTIAGRWMVYLGKFNNDMALEKRRAELRARKISFDRAGGNLDPGLSLGRFSSEEAATRELTNMLRQGVRGARVVQERASHTIYTLSVPHMTAAQRRSIQALPALTGKTLRPCS